jgi:hypothetical protein
VEYGACRRTTGFHITEDQRCDDIDLPVAGAKAAKEGSTERGKIVGQNVVPLVWASAHPLRDQALSA